MKGNRFLPLILIIAAIGYLLFDIRLTRPQETEDTVPSYEKKNYKLVKKVTKIAKPQTTALPTIPTNAIAGEVLVHFESKEELYDFIETAKKNGIEVSQVIDALKVAQFRFESEDQWKKLRELPGYGKESWNYPVETPQAVGTEATSFNGSSHLSNIGINEVNPIWGTGVKVAVLDTGIEAHYTLNNANIYEIDLLNQNTPTENSHGTAMLSLLAGQEEVQGIAPAADYYLYEVLDQNGIGDTFTVAQAIINAVENGADVISMSLGTYEGNSILQEAVNLAYSAGIPIIAPTGNEGTQQLYYPAAYDNVIAVGSTGKNNSLSEYSNYGQNISLSAPGDGLLTAASDDKLSISSGTSNSVPIVTGLVAALMAETPGLSANEAVELLSEYANDKGTPGYDILYGSGIPDLQRTLERIETNISDLRVADIYFLPQESGQSILEANIQNTGNTTQYGSTLTAEINGSSTDFIINDLAPKESTSIKLLLSSSGDSISMKISINNYTSDYSPEDNVVSGNITAP